MLTKDNRYHNRSLEACQTPSSEAVKPSGLGADYLLDELTKLGVKFEVVSVEMSFKDLTPPAPGKIPPESSGFKRKSG